MSRAQNCVQSLFDLLETHNGSISLGMVDAGANAGDTRMTIRLHFDGRTIERAALIPNGDEWRKETHLHKYESGITFLLNGLQRETPELFA